MIQKIVNYILSDNYSKVVIIESYGSGNMLDSKWFISEINSCMEQGKYVINVSQCPKGSVNMGKYESSIKLIDLGLISGKDITIISFFILKSNIKSKSKFFLKMSCTLSILCIFKIVFINLKKYICYFKD